MRLLCGGNTRPLPYRSEFILWDAVSKVVTLTACYSELAGVRYWRQWQYNLRKLKKQYRFIQKLKRSNSKQESKQKHRKNEIEQACGCYLSSSRLLIDRVKHTFQNIELQKSKKDEIERFITHAHRQINQIKRRIIDGEKIPHNEKVFSLFQPHTEWISKGKAGVTVEFGVKVAVMEDQYGFILHHRVMEKETDVPMAQAAKEVFPNLISCSYDKGFHSKTNQQNLKNYLTTVVLPKKGRRNKEESQWENSPYFKAAKRQHSAIESAINALEQHGLDRCPDHGIEGFKRYIALGVLARNIQKLGVILLTRIAKISGACPRAE